MFSRNVATDYFIPADLQGFFGKIRTTLSPYVTAERLSRFETVAAQRSRKVLCVFESTNHSHNISAVLRSVEAFGFQDAFFVYTDLQNTRFRINDSVERGTSHWLTLRRAPDLATCAKTLKSAGYTIALVSLPTFHRTAQHFSAELPHFSISQTSSPAFNTLFSEAPLALVFGNEKHGISNEWVAYADCYLSVDMFGFVESLNVSVCAGILLQGLRDCIEKNPKKESFLLPAHLRALLIEYWLARTVDRGEEILTGKAPELVPYLGFLRACGFYSPF